MTAEMTALPGTASRDAFGPLVDGDWALPPTANGLLSFTPKFESVVAGLQAVLTGSDPFGSAGPIWYAPVVPRATIDRSEYADGFPNLLGTVHALALDASADTVVGEEDRGATDLVLAPAVCYSVYPRIADGVIEGPRHFDAAGYCYRHEATSELGRFRSFRMREFVMVADAATARDWRDAWIARGEALFARLGVTVSVVPASDPFFGPGARLMRNSQKQQDLKYEFVAALPGQATGTAIASANYHKDHLGLRFDISYRGQEPAHTACTAFGIERIVLALIQVHGADLADWPTLA
ncbi:aminoacyl--tRNA ligase-related protein [Dactylosporangium sp. NPDC048998]|uniref:aminoacyl--tRNA ligase-related protein n=1 Tax=Dactylosporangium sp. NPDC048998 TaxID=3363976 RepID=UPI0037109E92